MLGPRLLPASHDHRDDEDDDGSRGGTGGRANPLISVRGKPNTSLSHSAGRTVQRRTDWPTNDLPARPAGWLPANKPLITLLGEHRADVEKLKREQGLPYEVRGGLLDLKLVNSFGIVSSYSTLGF